MDKTRMMIHGGVLMAYSHFVHDTIWLHVIGTALTVWVLAARNDS